MATGKVKWFNNAKGYGFILPEAGGEDLFAHYSSIEMDGYKTLKAGQEVEFDIMEGPKGYHAVNIRGGAEADADELEADGQADGTGDSFDSPHDAPNEAQASEASEDSTSTPLTESSS